MANDHLSSLILVAKSQQLDLAIPQSRHFYQERELTAVMPPRASRPNAGTPTRSIRGGSPSGSSVRSSDPRRLDTIRSPLLAKYSISYGSPLTQLPDRSSVGGDGKISSAAAQVFQQVRKDNRVSAARRREAARKAIESDHGAPADEVDVVQDPHDEVDELAQDNVDDNAGDDTIEEEVEEEISDESMEEAEEAVMESDGEDAEAEEAPQRQAGTREKPHNRPGGRIENPVAENRKETAQTQRRKDLAAAAKRAKEAADMEAAQMEAAKAARKRRRNDEDEAEEDLERIEREAQQRRERLAEAQRQAAQRRAKDLESARKRTQQAVDESRSNLSAPATAGLGRAPMTPAGTTGGNLQPPVPGTARSWQEEDDLYGRANLGSKPTGSNLTGVTHATRQQQQRGNTTPGGPPPPIAPRPRPEPYASGGRGAPPPALPPALQPPEVLRQTQGPGPADPAAAFVPQLRPNKSTAQPRSLPPPVSEVPRRPVGPGLPGRINQADLGQDGDRNPSRQHDMAGRRARPEKGNRQPDDGADDPTHRNEPHPDDVLLNDDHSISSQATEELDGGDSVWPGIKRISTPWNILKIIAIALLVLPILAYLRSAEFGHVLPPPPVLSDEQFDRLNDFLRDPSNLTPSARENLKTLLPRMIHMQRDRTGKLVIDSEFWHAIKDRIQEDDSIFTLDDRSRIAERQLKSLKEQFPVGPAQPTAQSWEAWLKKNEKKVVDLLGDNLDNIIKDKLPSDVVSSDEFVRELEAGLAKQKKAMDGALGDIKTTVKSVVDDVTKLKASAKTPKGMSEAEVTKLVDKMVNKAISKLQLKHAAKNGIAGALDMELQSRVNHFAFGNGATIDVSLTSPTLKMGKPRVGSWRFNQNSKKPQFMKEGHAALTPWDEAGNCWCAAISGSNNHTFPADLGIQVANLVIPEYIVLEHINPAATNDPDAMPKEVEIWADVIEPQRDRVKDWAAVTFPRTYSEGNKHDKLAQTNNLIKIGEFVYKYESATGGAHIHRLSEQLVETLKAATDTVLIRAKSNHGADHTCFYRVRMYGQVFDIFESVTRRPATDEHEQREKGTSWRPWQ